MEGGELVEGENKNDEGQIYLGHKIISAPFINNTMYPPVQLLYAIKFFKISGTTKEFICISFCD
jgi:hypothetical protein